MRTIVHFFMIVDVFYWSYGIGLMVSALFCVVIQAFHL
jgi:hypothetical protein